MENDDSQHRDSQPLFRDSINHDETKISTLLDVFPQVNSPSFAAEPSFDESGAMSRNGATVHREDIDNLQGMDDSYEAIVCMVD